MIHGSSCGCTPHFAVAQSTFKVESERRSQILVVCSRVLELMSFKGAGRVPFGARVNAAHSVDDGKDGTELRFRALVAEQHKRTRGECPAAVTNSLRLGARRECGRDVW